MGSSITKHVAGSETSGSEQGDCDYCQRRGLPIFPVRYAVCQRTDANEGIPELSDDRISAFTDIKLDQTLDDGETNTRVVPAVVKERIPHSTSSQVNKYILRQLRSGYLYLFDKDNTDGIYWHGFAITSDGKYYKFPVKQPPSLNKISFPCALSEDEQQEGEEEVQRKTSEAMHASMVTIPEPSKSGDVYYAYTEFAWPEDFLDEVEQKILSGDAWCDKYLQRFNVPSWDNGSDQTHAFSIDEFKNIAEFSDGAEGVKSHFLTSGDSRELYSREDIQGAMGSSARYEGRGLILAVNDEIGIIHELNAYRHEALASIDDFFDPKEGVNKEKVGEERRRIMLCKQAIEAFQENFERSYKLSEQSEKKDAVSEKREEKQKYIDDNESEISFTSKSRYARRKRINYSIHLARLDDEIVQAENDLDDYNKGNAKIEEQKKQAQIDLAKAEKEYAESIATDGPSGSIKTSMLYGRIGRLKREINDFYRTSFDKIADRHKYQLYNNFDSQKIIEFEEDLIIHNNHCHALMYANDCDYSLWTKASLICPIERCSKNNIYTGMKLSAAITDVLQGGILSPASASLWKSISDNITSHTSPIMCAYFYNNKGLMEAALNEIDGLPEDEYLDIDALMEWGEKFELFENDSIKLSGEYLEASSLSSDINSITTMLSVVTANSLSALRLYSIQYDLDGDDDSKNKQKKALKIFLASQQILFMADPKAQNGEIELPVMECSEVKVSDYYNALRVLIESTNKKTGNEIEKTQAFKSVNNSFGNFYTSMPESKGVLKIALPNMQFPLADKHSSEREVDYDSNDNAEVLDSQSQINNETLRKAKEALGEDFKALGVRGNILIQLLCIYELYRATDFSELIAIESEEDVSKLIGVAASATINTVNLLNSVQAVRPNRMMNYVSTKFTWKILGKSAAAISGAVSLFDGCKKFLDGMKAEKTGHTIEANNLKIMGGVTAVGGMVTVYAALFAGPVFGLAATVIIGIVTVIIAAYWITLVAQSVQTWVNRSILGVNEIQLNKFYDIVAEQNSLEMVFAGLIVDFSYTRESISLSSYLELGSEASSTSGRAAKIADEISKRNWEVHFNLILPKNEGSIIEFKAFNIDNSSILLDGRYQQKGGELILMSSFTSSAITSDGKVKIVDQGEDNNYELGSTLSIEFSPNTYLRLVVNYVFSGSRVSDVFDLECA